MKETEIKTNSDETPVEPKDAPTAPVEEVPAEVVPPSEDITEETHTDLMTQAEGIADAIIGNPDLLSQILQHPPAVVDKTAPAVVIDPVVLEAMAEFKFGTTIPLAGNLHASYAFKYALDDPNLIVWDLLLSPIPFEEALTKWPLIFQTPWGPVNELGYVPWYKIVGMTYDETNKRIVPVKLLMMTPSFAFKEVSALAIGTDITTKMILDTIDAVETHRSLVVGEEARTAKKEAKTYKNIVDRIFTIDYAETTEDMLEKAKEAEDKGDKAMSSAFKVVKDFWTTVRENWCWIALLIFLGIAFYLQNQGATP